MIKFLVIASFLVITNVFYSQTNSKTAPETEKSSSIMISDNTETSANNFTGILAIDSRSIKPEISNSILVNQQDTPGKKSPLLAGVMSLVVPGAGEVYTKSYWKAAIFIAIEAAAIAVDVIYNKKGDDKTVEFENYANANWNAAQYADWLNKYTDHLGLDAPDITIDPDVSKKPWDRVKFHEINTVENLISNFSHKLEPHGAQQYYELIGKYFQYKPGWADFPVAGWNNFTETEFDYWNFHTNMFVNYSDMFLEPDRIYQVASTAVIVMVTNHVLSAIDAAWTASRYNKKLTASVEMKQTSDMTGIFYYPQLNVQYRF